MKNVLKSNWRTLITVAFIVATMVLIVGITSAKAHPSSLAIQTSASATTTLSFMTPGTATTTYQFDSNGVFSGSKLPNMQSVDAATLYVIFAASSSSSVLVVTPQWSNNNIDWYGYQLSQGNLGTNGLSSFATTTLTYTYTPGASGTTTTLINLPAVAAQHERVLFSNLGANGAVYNEAVLKSNPSNP